MENKSKLKNLNVLDYDSYYYPTLKNKFILEKGAFLEGCFPPEIMSEEEVVAHFLRKSAVRHLLENSHNNIYSLSDALEIPVEKLLTFDCLTAEEIDKLDLLRYIVEESMKHKNVLLLNQFPIEFNIAS